MLRLFAAEIDQTQRDSPPRHCQSKFYTACLRIRAGQSSTVFAHRRHARPDSTPKDGLYLFALTVPAFVVNRAPQLELPTRNRHGHLIEMPTQCWPWASTPKFSGEQRPELQYPSSHRFVGDIQTALRKQIFDVAIAERETHIQPNGVPDGRRQELMAGNRDRHAPSYPTTGCALTFA